MNITNTKSIYAALCLSALLLAACGGNSGGGTAVSAPTYTIGGTLTGLTGTGLVLQNNATDDLAISADGAFTFVTPSAAYAVTVKTQPGNPVQSCTVNSGTGTAAANVTGITVTCSTNAYTVGGSVSGLVGTGLVLQDNNGDDLTISANGAFTFVTPSSAYAVSVKTQPGNPGQSCTVNSGTGTAAANVTGITVTCSTNAYTVSGSVSGLAGTGMVLQDNSGDDLTISANGAFTFAASVASGANYSVTVKTQPSLLSQACTVTNGSGAVSSANISGIVVSCITPSPRFAYVSNMNSGKISAYTINATTGALSTETLTASLGVGLYSVTTDPNGKFLYTTNQNNLNVSVLSIDHTTGALTLGTPVTVGSTGTNMGVAVDPAGKFAYVLKRLANTSSVITVFTIDPITGALTATGATAAAGTWPTSIKLTPNGKFAFVANNTGNNVSVFTVNQTTGELTAGTAIGAGTGPNSIAVHPSSKFVYVANSSSKDISVYTADQTTGALTAGTAATGGNYPDSVAVDPTGRFAYVANQNSNDVWVYTINQTSGALTFSTLQAASPTPSSVAVDPSGKFVYVTTSGANPNPDSILVYTIDQTTGALTPVSSALADLLAAGIVIVGQ
jgi:6-phosphogluconolactonase (cycloisomerase 2 family)